MKDVLKQPSVTRELLKEAVLQWLSDGGVLLEFCRDNHLAASTVYRWCYKDEGFKQRFAQARIAGCEVIAERCIEVANDSSKDWIEVNGTMVHNKSNVQRDKLKVHVMQQFISKVNPSKYGDKIDLNHGGNIQLDTAVMKARKRIKKDD